MSNETHTGGISVQTEHIFPIIKKWLYSEREIFLRELVSNATDAVTKLRRLTSLGQAEIEAPDYRVTVSFNKTEKTLTVSDNGIGMSAEEVETYICNMALSGALDFIRKYEGESEDKDKVGIIGHFGLGFYSAFMVADRVELLTRSYTDAPAVHWSCEEDGSYEWQTAAREERGTSVILHINEDSEEYLSLAKLREILDHYCAFMPVPIYLCDEEADAAAENPPEPTPVNDPSPLWQRPAADCTEEDYKSFYQKVFADYREPLFHLHINADYPLNFKGVLFFPKIEENYESLEGKIKLYYNQVFVADNIKEVIPEYLLMLRGVIDCPELPLNVSRSYLQNSAYVSKVSAYLAKKVADKLCSMFQNEREHYEAIWPDLRLFVQYGAISDRKFYDRVASALLLPMAGGGLRTVDEVLADASGEGHENTVYYATDEHLQAQYIEMLRAKGYSVAVLNGTLDTRFLQSLEQYREGVKFLRVDAATDALRESADCEQNERASELFAAFTAKDLKLTVRCERLTDEKVPVLLVVNEEENRMREMMRMYAPGAPLMPTEATLSLNIANKTVARLLAGEYGEKTQTVAGYLFSLALLSHRRLDSEEMLAFLRDSYTVLSDLS